jgi:hydroxymethylpyrimidine/phosphomethylpyrimidine kinase
MAGRVLTVAESDSSGAAGIQADIKTILALGGYTTTALSAVTAQDTKGIACLQALDPAFVAQQMRVVLADIGADAIKTGTLINTNIVNAVADVLDEYQHKNLPVVIDPSIMARNGGQLMDGAAIAALKRRLFVRATVLTPSNREAELLTGMPIRDIDDMRHAAAMMRTLGAETVVLKAGQAISEKVIYLVATAGEERIYERPMLDTKNTLGAGCTLASAITISLAQNFGIFLAIERSLDFMHRAIESAPGFGSGAGPMNHAFDIEKHSTFFNLDNVKLRKAQN